MGIWKMPYWKQGFHVHTCHENLGKTIWAAIRNSHIVFVFEKYAFNMKFTKINPVLKIASLFLLHFSVQYTWVVTWAIPSLFSMHGP
jgi:hypothetical protein